tara:strand:+ start:7879 stop:9117 length:1239 start_codon:yes stop_codon:yes gene_type:complete
MATFSRLPLIDFTVNSFFSRTDLSDVFIISVQHLLSTTGSLFEGFVEMGIDPRKIFLLGKVYSNNIESIQGLRDLGINVFDSSHKFLPGDFKESFLSDVKKIWAEFEKGIKAESEIIILDEGGYLLNSIPERLCYKNKIVGIEQTTFGVRSIVGSHRIPVIDVARSATKKKLEAPLVAETICNRIIENQSFKGKVFGIVGCGNIGSAIFNRLKVEANVLTYDMDISKIVSSECSKRSVTSVGELLSKVDVVLGATGFDISGNININSINENKIFINVSSGDIEFNEFLRTYSKSFKRNGNHPTDDLVLELANNAFISIPYGGMVYNFDRSRHSVSPNKIQLTRSLLMAAFIQALSFRNHSGQFSHALIPLKAEFQKAIVQEWLKIEPSLAEYYSDELISSFHLLDWINQNSV